ncbi:MAG TPA: ABC transporter permease [Stellaceae bacterium]|nr:ABC transporter permease [Stellaceae bacterium]
MYAYVLRRLLATIPVMAVVAVFVFLLLHLAPGDPAAIIAGDYAQPADIARIRTELGLDQPIYVQFWRWLWSLLHGDLGVSIFSGLPVTRLIAQRLQPTLAIASGTIVMAVMIAVPLGVIAAWKAGSWIDRLIMVFAVLGFSIPVFVIGYIFIYAFAIALPLFPVEGYAPIERGIGPFLHTIFLPCFVLAILYAALLARITRASMLEILTEDYIRTAHAKGLSSRTVLVTHALRNAAVPIATVIGIGVALLLGGVVVTESVFNIPGLGRLTVDAILHRDYPVIQGLILVFSLIYVVVNLLIDLSYAVFDPRIRY